MKRPGLTEAMRRTIEYPRSATHGMRSKAIAAGFITKERDDDRSNYVGYPITPRGQAALAAPRVTAAELAVLEQVPPFAYFLLNCPNRMCERLKSKGWLTTERDGDDETMFVLTPAGTTALNNVRAASGSADWKEAK